MPHDNYRLRRKEKISKFLVKIQIKAHFVRRPFDLLVKSSSKIFKLCNGVIYVSAKSDFLIGVFLIERSEKRIELFFFFQITLRKIRSSEMMNRTDGAE